MTNDGSTVRAVIFDYGGVLRREEDSQYDALGARYEMPGRWVWRAFHTIPEYLLSRTGRIDAETYRAAVVECLARWIGPERGRALLDEWDRTLALDAPIEPEFVALVGALRRSVRVGLLSNAGAGHTERLRAMGVAAHFDDVVCSGDVGLAKPDPAIFRLAAERLGVEAADCAFIDDREEHCAGARSVGMRAHRYRRDHHKDLVAFLAAFGFRSA